MLILESRTFLKPERTDMNNVKRKPLTTWTEEKLEMVTDRLFPIPLDWLINNSEALKSNSLLE
jgi:hypothetical protein